MMDISIHASMHLRCTQSTSQHCSEQHRCPLSNHSGPDTSRSLLSTGARARTRGGGAGAGHRVWQVSTAVQIVYLSSVCRIGLLQSAFQGLCCCPGLFRCKFQPAITARQQNNVASEHRTRTQVSAQCSRRCASCRCYNNNYILHLKLY